MDLSKEKTTNSNEKKSHKVAWLDVLSAGALGWALPGLGHWVCGQRKRGCVVGVSIALLWSAGLLTGGFSVVDGRPAPTGQRGWFYAQAGIGASVWVERAHARMRLQDALPPLALGRGREIATLYLAAAGLLNMMAIADAMLRAAKPHVAQAAKEDA